MVPDLVDAGPPSVQTRFDNGSATSPDASDARGADGVTDDDAPPRDGADGDRGT